MIGLHNQFNHSHYLPSEFVIETAPLCSIKENQVRSERTGDQDARIYNAYNQSKDRITQQTNLVDKIARILKNDDVSEEDAEHSVEVQTRYFNLDSMDVLSKGVCRRCKKPGHFEKWCVEDIAEAKTVCRFCLGDHFYLKCPNSLCYKCNQFGHMAKDCHQEGVKCHRCNKRGHKSKDCYVIDVNDENVFEKDKQRLKDLICLNCRVRGHLNCFSKEYRKIDSLYCSGKEFRERERMNDQNKGKYSKNKQPLKAIKTIAKVRDNFSESSYDVWSEESPNAKRMSNNKRRKQNKKQKNKQKN